MSISKNRISLKEASEITGYHPDYLSQLIRKNVLSGERIGRTWVTTKEDVLSYLSTKKFVSGEKAFLAPSRQLILTGILYAAAFILIFVGMVFYFLGEVRGIESYEVVDSTILDVSENGAVRSEVFLGE